MKTKQVDEQRGVWITTFDRELRRACSRQHEGDDICSRRLVHVLENLEKFSKMHQSPEHEKLHSIAATYMEKLPEPKFYTVVSQ